MLPGTPEAVAWHERTIALLAQFEREEAEAAEAFRVARERLRRARIASAAIGKVLGFVTVDEPIEAAEAEISERDPATPTPLDGGWRPLASLAEPRAMSDGAPEAEAPRRWARRHDHCVDCETTDRPHLAQGRCARCYWRVKAKGPRTDDATN